MILKSGDVLEYIGDSDRFFTKGIMYKIFNNGECYCVYDDENDEHMISDDESYDDLLWIVKHFRVTNRNNCDLNNVIKQIKSILPDEFKHFSMNIYFNDEIVFNIYEIGIPIVVNLKSESIYLECESCNNEITPVMMDELAKIMRVLEENIDVLVSLNEEI